MWSRKIGIVYELFKVLNEGKIVCLSTPRKDVVMELLRVLNAILIKYQLLVYEGSLDKGKVGNLYVILTHQLIIIITF